MLYVLESLLPLILYVSSLKRVADLTYRSRQTKQLQLQIANCGWKEAADLRQHDASEAFTFLTETLALPLLTLKMDIFHTGKEDLKDDHKFINERLLELAIPDEPSDNRTITLEECLEMFFNNKIEVKRYLDSLERRNTVNSTRSRASLSSTKGSALHVEIAEVGDSQPSSPAPISAQENSFTPTSPQSSAPRRRAPSIIQEHYINEKYGSPLGEDEKTQPRVRKEVMMPAWQFFSLIRKCSSFVYIKILINHLLAWYTNKRPSNDAQVANHFSTTRPILGICLKRYGMNYNGRTFKRRTRIDIPLDIGLPHFISDDDMSDDGPAFGNFKLSLQSVVCHQGISVEAGHYISFVRSPDSKNQGKDQWMRFDDLAKERVVNVSIEDSLKRESPYLLFYQVTPIEGESNIVNDESLSSGDVPPSYAESNPSKGSKPDLSFDSDLSIGFLTGDENPAQRLSFETSISEDGNRGRPSTRNATRESVLFPNSYHNKVSSAPAIDVTSVENSRNTLTLNPRANLAALTDEGNTLIPSRQGSKRVIGSSKGRPNSSSGDNRLSASLSRLANRMSRDRLTTLSAGGDQQAEVPQSTTSLPLEAGTVSERARKEARYRVAGATKDHNLLTNSKKPDRECIMM